MSRQTSTHSRARLLGGFLVMAAIVACSTSDGTIGPEENPEIELSLDVTAVEMLPGQSMHVEGILDRSGGYVGTVLLSVADAPQGVSASIEDEATNGGRTTATIVFEVAANAAPGVYPMTVRATGAGVSEASTVFTLTILQPPELQIGVDPASLDLARGSGMEVQVTLTRTGFDGAVSLDVEALAAGPAVGPGIAAVPLPEGITASFSPNPTTGDETTLTILVGAGVTPDTHMLALHGSSAGNIEATTTLTLVVDDGPLDLETETVEIAVGGSHACTLDGEGRAYCWGSDAHGQVGDDPDLLTEFQPSAVSGGHTFAALASGLGGTYSCALDSSGDAHCWGSNDFGQLGNGAFSGAPNPAPGPVAGGLTFVSLTAGGATTCGLTSSGTAYCWGADSDTQLGDGPAAAHRASPTPVSGDLTFTQLSSGGRHVCGLDPDGLAYCWGADDTGQIGDGQPLVPKPTPTPVTGAPTFTRIAAGGSHTCALDLMGLAYCWGQDSLAEQLGDGDGALDQTVPVQVLGTRSYVDIIAGISHTCALTDSNNVYCWGSDQDGQLGNDGVFVNQSEPVRVSGGHRFRSIAAGGRTTCGVTIQDQVFCWGDDSLDQVGDGSGALDISIPVEISLP